MTDRYLNTDECVARLRREYEKHKKLIVAVDFDDTVFPFHDKSDIHARVWSVLQECAKRDFYVVIYTASSPDRFDMMRAYFSKRGVTVASVNENPIPLPFGKHGKIYYNIFLDDRAGLISAVETLETFLSETWNDAYPDEDRDEYQARLYR